MRDVPRDRPTLGIALALALVPAAFGLGGCAGRTDIQTGAIAERVPTEKSFVDMPPGGPAIVGVVQRTFANSTTQEIILGTSSHTLGQNSLSISVFGPVKLVTSPENLETNDALSISRVSREMGAALPGVPMKVSVYYAQNRYGSFGYASGISKQNDMCLYAWQRIRAPELDSTVFGGRGTIQIRLRLCQTGASEGDLLAVMTGFSINAYLLSPSWNPYGDPAPAPAEYGQLGKTVLPTKENTAAPVVVAPAPVVARPPVVKRVKRPRPVVVEQQQPAPEPPQVNVYQDYGMVPPPSP